MRPSSILVALATVGGAMSATSVASADQVKIRAVGNVIFHDPNDFLTHNPGTNVSLGGCRNPGWPTSKLRYAYVQLREDAFPSSPVRAEGWTDKDGNFDLTHLNSGEAAHGDVHGTFYVQVWTLDNHHFNRIDVHDWQGTTFKLDAKHHHGVHHFDKNAPVQKIEMGTVDFDETDDQVLRCSGAVYAHVMNAYDKFELLTGHTRLPADNGHVSVTFGWGTNGMWTYWNNIRIEREFNAWDLQSIYHEFGHRIFFGADSPNGPLPFLDDATRFNYARSHDGTEVRHWGYAWSEGWADFNHAVYRPEFRPNLRHSGGGSGDGVNNDVENDIARKLLQYAGQCGGGEAGIEAAYKSFVETLLANPGPDLALDHRMSSKPIHSFSHFVAAHKARTGCDFSDTGHAGSPIVAGQDRPDPSIAVALGGALDIIQSDGSHYSRISSTDGQQWLLDAAGAHGAFGAGAFTSGPASAISGNNLHVFGRGQDNKIWRAYSADGGRAWQVAWTPIGQGLFTSAPAAAVSADGRHLHVFGRGQDNKIWRAYSADGGATWPVAWAPIGQGTFTSAPAAAISADGRHVHVFGRGQDNKIWRAYSADGGTTWPVAWTPIGEGVFTSAPAAAISADGRHLHVFGRGNDNKTWRAYSADGGGTWSVAWSPIGEGVFTSAPAAALSADGQHVQVFGRGNDNNIWRAESVDGARTWRVAWAAMPAAR